MSKPRRNDPCPCGSGKKYKKCCGLDNVISFDPIFQNNELQQLKEDLWEYALSHFQSELQINTEEYIEIYLTTDEDEAFDTYIQSLTSWLVLYEPIQNDQTIFDLYYDRNKQKLKHPSIRKALSNWPDGVPGIFQIKTVENHPLAKATVEDMFTGSVYNIELHETTKDDVGDFLVGILIPYVNMYDFLFDVIQVSENQAEHILHVVDEGKIGDENIVDIFPELLANIIQPSENINLEWINIEHELVAELFAEHMTEKGFDHELIMSGVFIWNQYCMHNHPNIRKRAGHAAALEYIIQLNFVEDSFITQSQLAEEYETSAGTVSTHYRRLDDFLANEFNHWTESNRSDFPPQTSNVEGFNMEQEMRNIQKLLENESFETNEEASMFLNNLLQDGQIPSAPMDARDMAQDLIYEAANKQGREKQRLIDEALDVYPNSPDAYLLLAEDAKSDKEYRRLLQSAINVGEKDLGKEFFKANKGHFWGLIETRPYMRAKASYAKALEDAGFTEEAVKHYENLLTLNPNDNQGIRDQLLSLYIFIKDFDKANQLLDAYENDGTASFLFNQALMVYLTEGLTERSTLLLKKATDQNKYVLDYLKQTKKIPHMEIQAIQLGGETEAIVYAQENIHLWADADEFIK